MNNSSEIQQTIKNQVSLDNSNKDFELSHIIGLNLSIPKPVQSHPTMNETILYSVGGIIVSEDLSDKNNQVFFRHGINLISCFKISNTGRILAVGFTSGNQNLDKKLPVSILLWDYEKKIILYELTGMTKAVISIEFSQDDKFISATGADNYFYIWEVETGYKCHSRIYEFPLNLVYWTTINTTQSKSKPEYTITLSSVNGMQYLNFYFELKSMQYNMKTNKFTLPSTGFVRSYTCGVYDQSIKSLYLGTSGGELSLFALENLVYKSSFNVINNGVMSLLIVENEDESCLIIGGGDGRVRKMIRQGNDASNAKHILTDEIQFSGKITSLSLLSDNREVICSNSLGYIYRMLVSDLTYTLHSVAHTSSVNDISFCKLNERCFTVDDNGNALMWDLNDFVLLGSLNCDSMAKCITIGDDDTVFIGYANGFIKNYSLSQQNEFLKLWEVPAHRGNVNTVYVDSNYILTGGEDGIVRVWTRKTHELIIQLSAHHKNVYNVFADINKPNLIYTCGADKSLNTFDIKMQKTVNIHNIKNGVICGIAQKIDGANEIISCGYNCNFNVWDFYQNDPIAEINFNDQFFTLKISNSGKYFAMGSESGELWIFSLPLFEFICKSTGHSMRVNCLKWSPDDKQIVSVSSDSSVCVWNFYKILS